MSRLIFMFFLGLVICPATALADGQNDERQSDNQQQIFPGVPPAPEAGSDAQFDKRLPPVLAGEYVNDSGRTKRVWSTSGPVPVANAPEPWKDQNQATAPATGNGSLSVIVDQRDQPVAVQRPDSQIPPSDHQHGHDSEPWPEHRR